MTPDTTKKRRQKVTKTPLTGKQKNTIKPEPLIVALILKFTDPAGDVRLFPKDFPVEVIYGDNQKTDKRKIDNDEGKLIFRLRSKDAKKYKFLRLNFVSGKNNYIICEKRGEATKTTQLGTFKKSQEKAKNGQRFFRLPAKWSLLISDWKVTTDAKIYNPAEKEKKFLLVDSADKPQNIGTKITPIETLLDPHWQYLKFEFFDRYYGHSDHTNKPISIPPISVEGFNTAKASKKTPGTRSNWTLLQGGDEKKIVQCLPWIVQAKKDGTKLPKPNEKSGLQFKQPKDTFIISKSATERNIKESKSFSTAEKDSLKPCAERLKYYDLPETWKSQKYWSFFSDSKDEQGFFEKMAEKETKLDKPLIFSLDDIILTDDKIAPLSARETDRIVVFYHEFLDAVSDANKKGDGGRTGATYLKNGLYKPGPDLVEAKKKASDNAKAEEKTKLEKEARDAAVATQTKKEEDDARAAAESLAKTANKKDDEVKADGDKAVADVASDAAAQQRIKTEGDTAATNVATDSAAQTKINTAGTNAATQADAPAQAKIKGAANQREIEEKKVRDPAEATQTKKEEDDARAAAAATQTKKEEDDARAAALAAQTTKEENDARTAAETISKKTLAGKMSRDTVKKAGDNAAAKVATDQITQKRIVLAGDNAVANVATDTNAQARIKTEGDNAVTNVATDTNAQARIKTEGDNAVANVATDTNAQARIKTEGDKEVAKLTTNTAAQKRITDEGKAAENAAMVFPFSDILRHKDVPNYISDYPHWSRLVVFNGNLFDVFDKRTTSGDVIGARAAVRFVDATASGVGVKSETKITALPAVVPAQAKQEEAYFVVQPYYRQNFFMSSSNGTPGENRDAGFYDEWSSPITNGDNKIDPIGRNDLALLRTSNYKDENEEAVVFVYHRFNIDFTSEPNGLGDTLPTPEADFSFNPPHYVADLDTRKEMRHKWTKDFANDVGYRWSGNDGVNNSRPWIQEKKTANPKFRTQIVSFLQQQTDDDKAHFKIKMLGTGSWMAIDGTAEFEVEDGRDTLGMGFNQKFAGAHEYGHAGGQPDDYAPSGNGQTGFGSNDTAGAPYILDRNAMMSSNNQIRARSYWHITEWLRKLKPFSTTNFQVLHGGYTYEVPHYNHADRPGRNYTHWNVKAKIFHSSADPIYYDSHLYFLGQDEYSRVVLPSQPDGIIVVLIKLLFKFAGYSNNKVIIQNVFNKVNQKINTALNNTRVHAKFSLPGINRGGTNTFEKCMLHFSPRFEVDEGKNLPSHLKINIKTPPDKPAAPTIPTAPGSSERFKYTGNASKMRLAGLFSAIKSGQIKPDTQVDDGRGVVQEANNFSELKTLFDVYYWYDDSGYQGPKTLPELYDLAKAGTIKWDTNIKGPGWVAEKHADKITELLPALKRWFYKNPGKTGPFTEMEMHGNFNTVPLKEDTDVTGEPTADTWKKAKEWADLEAKFTDNVKPRTLDFRFPINAGTIGAFDPVVTHLENVIFRDVCQLLGLSDDSTKANHYEKAEAYKDIVRACVNDTSLNPTMSR